MSAWRRALRLCTDRPLSTLLPWHNATASSAHFLQKQTPNTFVQDASRLNVSTTCFRQNATINAPSGRSSPTQPQPKRKTEPKPSLRRVAVEAERSREGRQGQTTRKAQADGGFEEVKTVTAYCAAEQYNIPDVARVLKSVGYTLDPFHTDLYPQVVHFQVNPGGNANRGREAEHTSPGDVFVFPSGTLVAWDVPDETVTGLISRDLITATENPHLQRMETEDLEFVQDPSTDKSNIIGDRITLGTGLPADSLPEHSSPSDHAANLTLAKIAFSSGLARSTKLAVLETALDAYSASTRSIPTLLQRGSRLPFTRSFILRKTGELFSVRAQLNLYSELTDALPDLFWDSRHELGLEGYFERVGKALDVNVRIRALNQKMDYAQEIAAVLRERLSEGHGLLLEWLIIGLIAIEVAFEVLRLWRERREREDPESMESVMRRYYEAQLRRLGEEK